MYKNSRKFYIFLSIILSALLFTGCSQVTMDMKDAQGEWTVKSLCYDKKEQNGTVDIMANNESKSNGSQLVNEFTTDEFAVMIGKKEIVLARNFKIGTDSMEMTIYDPSKKDTVTVKYDVEPKFNGFYSKDGDTIKGSYKYDKDNDAITFIENIEGRDVRFTLKRGTTDIMALSDKDSSDSEDEQDSDE